MNTKAFKTLIKQAVKEVIQEELSAILKEAVLGNRQTQNFLNESNGNGGNTEFSFNTNDVINRPSNPSIRSRFAEMQGINVEQPVKQQVPDTLPFLEMFKETAENMTAMDRQALSRLD